MSAHSKAGFWTATMVLALTNVIRSEFGSGDHFIYALAVLCAGMLAAEAWGAATRRDT